MTHTVRFAMMVGLLALAACTSSPHPEPSGAGARAAAAELELLARHAVEDRLAAGDVPDLGLLEGSRRIILRREMKWAGLRMSSAARPEVAGLEVDLLTEAAIQERAEEMGAALYYVAVDYPEITGETATINLGMEVALPRGAGPNLCCCTGKALYRRSELDWTFVEWESEWCR